MDIERLKEHDLYVLRDVVSGLEEEQSIDPVIARQFEKVIDEALQAYQPWVNVEDRLPDGNVSSVLFFTEDGGVAEQREQITL